MLPAALFRRPAFGAANAVAAAMNLGTLGMLFVLTLYLQDVQGRSAARRRPGDAARVRGAGRRGPAVRAARRAASARAAPMVAGLLSPPAGSPCCADDALLAPRAVGRWASGC